MPHKDERVIYQVALPERDGFELTAYVVDDPDFDAHTSYDNAEFAEHIQAWERGEWQGVGLIVEASREGAVLGDASIWGSEYGTIDGDHVQPIDDDGTDNIGYLDEKIREAIDAARTALTETS